MRPWILAGLVVGILLAPALAGAAAPNEPAAPAVAPDAAGAKADPAAEAAYMQRLKEVRLIEIKSLRTGNEKDFQAGREKILALAADPATVKALVQVLYGENARYRGLLIEALGKFAANGSKLAQGYLQEVAVGDVTASHRRKAVENLKGYSGDKPTDRLMAHLVMQKVPELRDRAATALAALDEKRAIWLLVERLVTEEQRVTGAEVRDAQVTMDLRLQQASLDTSVNASGFQTYTITAAVAFSAVPAQFTIELPRVNVVDAMTTVAMSDRDVQLVIQRTQVQHPEILAALKALTGKDFGYNQAAWQKWLQSEEAAKIVPAWEMMRKAAS
jgi:NACalpha-BTF3-like transcription factor